MGVELVAWIVWTVAADGEFAKLWIGHGLLHILFVPDFLAHIDAQPCVCSVEAPEEVAEDADEEAAAAHAEAVAEHAKTCLEECPPEAECALEQEEEESDEDFQARCDEAAKAAAEEGDGVASEGD